MTTGMVNELVDGLVVLEIGRKDVAQVAQLIIDAVLDHAENVVVPAHFLSFLSRPAGLLS